MKQVVQSYRTGKLRVADVPAPGVEPGCVLVRTTASIVSVGTERMAVNLAKKSLLGKARERPDLVRKVLERVARDGVVATGRAVFEKLDKEIPLGYSCVGTITAVGEGISEFALGDRVACAGAAVANHAEVNLVPRNLCARVPDGVDDESAAFVTVGAVALQAVRTANPTIGETFAVIGLGLIGQLAMQLLSANGCRVIGIDLDAKKVELANRLGFAAVTRDGAVVERVAELTDGRGVDGVLIAAATKSNDPVELAGQLCRDRARVVAVGAVGMEIPRRPYYDKELSFHQSRSYGPGRYDPVYEELGIDYPIGYVRWTEQRNMQAFLQLCAGNKLNVAPLVTHRFAIEKADEAYRLITTSDEPMGILLRYPATEQEASRSVSRTTVIGSSHDQLGLGVIGAGGFASAVLIPAIQRYKNSRLVSVASARGVSAQHVANRFKFERYTTDEQSIIASPDVHAIFIATRHHLHAAQATAALKAGKHVYVEKPLALDSAGLAQVLDAQRQSGAILMVGFNRRFSRLARDLKSFFSERAAPLVFDYRVNAGQIPADSWIHDPAVGGGRIIGEVCHFVDLIAFIAGALPTSVFAHSIQPTAGARADDNIVATMRLADGSLATISYVATGDATAGKERLEVLGNGAVAVLEDFRSLRMRQAGREKVVSVIAQDKGHDVAVAEFLSAARRGNPSPIRPEEIAATTETTFAIMQSLATGQPVTIAG